MVMWRNTLRGTLYTEDRQTSASDSRYSWVRNAKTGKLTRVLADHLVEYTPAEQVELPVPVPDQPVPAPEWVDATGVPRDAPTPEEMSGRPRLPAVHGDLRNLSYNTGSAVALVLEAPENTDALRVAILMLGDEVDRLRGQ